MLPLSYGAASGGTIQFGNPWHGTRVSFDRSGYRSVAWRLSISGGDTPVRPRGSPNGI